LHFCDGNNFLSYVVQLCLLWQKINTIGGTVNDISFYTIILESLLASWNSIITILYTSTSSTDVLTQLNIYWFQVSSYKRKGLNSLISPTILQTNSPQQIVCSNTNYQWYPIEKCYWLYGGKQGQFPSGFGK